MKEHLNQLNQRREYYEEIATERAIKEAEAEEAERIRVSVIIRVRYSFFIRECTKKAIHARARKVTSGAGEAKKFCALTMRAYTLRVKDQ